MTERLRELFDDMVADEPPLRTTADDAAAAGRRLVRRNRTMWTVAGTTLVVAAAATLPQVWVGGGSPAGQPAGDPSNGWTPTATSVSPEPSITPSGPTPTGTGEPPLSLTLSPYVVCPSADPMLPSHDVSVLPDPAEAVQAVLGAAPRIAPGMEFRVVAAELFMNQPKFNGDPWVSIVFDVGDATGFGSVTFQIRPEMGAEPAERASQGANISGACVDGWRHEFADGSVGLHYPYGPPEMEARVTHVWYYASGEFTMNIGMFPEATPISNNDDLSPIPSPLPARGSMPLSIEQVMLVAHVIATA